MRERGDTCPFSRIFAVFVRAREREKERIGLSLIPWKVRGWVMAGERGCVKGV